MWRWSFFLCALITKVAFGQEPFWLVGADGLRDADELLSYRQVGMTVVWVSMPYRPDGDFSAQDSLMDAAGKEGLPCILALDLRPPPTLRQTFLCAPHDPTYLMWLRRWLDTVIPHFRTRTNLLGYALGRQADEAVSHDDVGFVLFLKNHYQTTEALTKAWGVPVELWQTVTQIQAMQADDKLSQIRYGRPSLDAALYRWVTLRSLLTLWAQEVRSRDPNPKRLLIAGPLTTYRSLAVVPPLYQVVVPFLSPERAEADWLTHNAHAVAIARRSGRFRVMPMVTTRLSDGRFVAPEVLTRWMAAALAQGASGFLFNDWAALREFTDLSVIVTAFVKRVQTEVPPEVKPIPKAAILYTPFGEGLLDAQGFPLYGFSQPTNNQMAFPLRLSLDEPAPLFFALRFNSWGIIDCLVPEDLTTENLRRYGVLFAPMPAYLELTMQSALVNFVGSGGILVADFGVGAFQSDEPFLQLPPLMQQLFGVVTLRRILFDERLRVNMVVFQPHPLFPTVPEGLELGKPMGAFPFIVGMTPAFTAQPWAILTMARFAKRGRFPGRVELAAAFTNTYGHGYAIFVPTLLWALWSPQDVGFADFHGSLIARRATMKVQDNDFVPTVWVSEMDKGIFVHNPTNEKRIVRLQLRSPIFLAYSDSTSRPLETSPSSQEIIVSLLPNDWTFLKPVAKVSPPVVVQVLEATPERMQLRLLQAKVSKTTLCLFGTCYRTDTLRHTVTIVVDNSKEQREVQPDQWGVLTISDLPVPAKVIVTFK